MTRAQLFQSSTIYHIRHAVTRKVIYVGSSTAFSKRVHKHKSNCNNPTSNSHYHYPVYQYIRDNGGWDAYHVVPVSHHNLQNKVELQILEQAEIDKYDDLKNAHYAKRTKAEYDKQYYQTNAAAISVDRSTKVRCECGCIGWRKHISTHRKTSKHLRWATDNDHEVFKLVPLFQ